MKAYAVIGMNFGDEGKGHITNYLSDSNTLNVRFNGGAQAAHGVFLSDGRSHVFHHFGAGSMRGARTLLASRFIVNPLIFAKEMWLLSKKTPMREIFIDPRCRVTTPYDMLINEFSALYHKKNDTCGAGINETVQRSVYRQLKISAKDFYEKTDAQLESVLKTVCEEYLPFRIKELGLPWDEFEKFSAISLNGNEAVKSFLAIRSWMNERLIVIWPDDGLIDKFLAKDKRRKVVFEGAQGILLDQNRKEFMPYLTRSNTGIKNVLSLLQTVRTEIDLEVLLTTRAYLTRHGDGPLWNHIPNTFPFPGIEEQTNVTNVYQGAMRYGYLSRQWYDRAIAETESVVKNNRPSSLTSYSVNVAMTCCDQIGSRFMFCKNGDGNDIKNGNIMEFPRIKLMSSGKTEKDITEL